MRANVRIGPRMFDTLVAGTPADRERGLQGRGPLREREAMIFLWPGEAASQRTFHMGTVTFPIAIFFIKDGRVKNIVAGLPGDRQRWTGYCDAVIETSLPGAIGLHVGDPIDIDDILPGRYASRMRTRMRIANTKLYRAVSSANLYTGFKSWWSADEDVARAYTDNPGFGGDAIIETDVTGKVLDLRVGTATATVEFWSRLLDIVGLDKQVEKWIRQAESAFDEGSDAANLAQWAKTSGYAHCHDVVSVLAETLSAHGQWVRIIDSYPEDADAWMCLSKTALPSQRIARRMQAEAGELADVSLLAAAVVRGALLDESHGGGVPWRLDALTGDSTASAVIGKRELRQWLLAAGLPETQMKTVLPAATEPAGWSAIGDAFVATGACDLARQTTYGLVLQRLR